MLAELLIYESCLILIYEYNEYKHMLTYDGFGTYSYMSFICLQNYSYTSRHMSDTHI